MSEDDKALVSKDAIVGHIATYAKGKLKWKIDTLPNDILEKSAEELQNELLITDTDRKLRLNFHKELERASKDQDVMMVQNICKGICHSNTFLKKLDEPKRLGWLMLPYEDNQLRIEHQVIRAQDAVDELFNINIYDRQGNLDHRAAKLKFDLLKLIYDKRYPNTQININKETEAKEEQKNVEDRIKQLESELFNKNG